MCGKPGEASGDAAVLFCVKSCSAMPASLSTQAWPPLAYGPGVQRKFIDRLFSQLHAGELVDISEYARSLSILRWSTCCSGTESPAWSMEPFEDKLRTLVADLRLHFV